MIRRALLAASLAASCRCSDPAPPVPPTPLAPAATAPTAATPKPDNAQWPSTLSLLRPGRQGTCDWMRIDPASKREQIVATVDVPCDGARLAWSEGGSKTLAVFTYLVVQGMNEVREFRVVLVDTATGEQKVLPTPAFGEVFDAGFDGQTPVLLTMQPFAQDDETRPEKIEHQGKSYPVPAGLDGIVGLAHAWRLGADGKWTATETVVSAFGNDGSKDVSVLAAAARLGTRSKSLTVLPARTIVKDAALVDRLNAHAPEQRPGVEQWNHLDGIPSDAWVLFSEIDAPAPTERLVMKVADELVVAAETPDEPGLAHVFTRGPWILVASDAGRSRLYDARTATLAATLEDDAQVRFWP